MPQKKAPKGTTAATRPEKIRVAMKSTSRRGFTKGIHSQAAKDKLKETAKGHIQSKYGAGKESVHILALRKTRDTGSAGQSGDLSHKVSFKSGRDTQEVLGDANHLTPKQFQAFSKAVNVAAAAPLSDTHRDRLQAAHTALQQVKTGPLSVDQKSDLIFGAHSVVNGSSANLRHRDLSENRGRAQYFHPNTTDGTADGPSTPRGAAIQSFTESFGTNIGRK